jgi:manganese-transporting P-type ATPase
LTTDELVLAGVGGLPISGSGEKNSNSSASSVVESTASKSSLSLVAPQNLPDEVTYVLGGCHSLVHLDGELVGDPMETAALRGIDWKYSKSETASSNRGRHTLHVVQRYHFNSNLKRMTTVVTSEESGTKVTRILAKGAPEVMQSLYSSVPSDYEDVYKHYSRMGLRVLALGYRRLPSELPPNELRNLTREAAEKELTFGGFVAFKCPLKSDSLKTVEMLTASSHAVIMITGDNTLTACHVAKELSIVTKPALMLNDEADAWVSMDERTTIPFSSDAKFLPNVAKTHDLCISGQTLAAVINHPKHRRHLPLIKVFARVSPEQKEDIINTFKSLGLVSLMAGDGTNDVGALKQAEVGVAILNKIEITRARKPQTSDNATKKVEAATSKVIITPIFDVSHIKRAND